jgi:hypothetical protein
MTDNGCDEFSLVASWRAIGHRIAVIGGCFVGLISLFNHVPVSTVAMRGGATWFGVLIVSWLSSLALDWANRFDQMAAEKAKQEEL